MIEQSKRNAASVELRLASRTGHPRLASKPSASLPTTNIVRIPPAAITGEIAGGEVAGPDASERVDDEFCELIRRVRDGSQEAAATLIRKYQHHVMLTARRMLSAKLRAKFDSSDFVQAVWASFFAKCLDREEFTHPKHLVAYLVGMARRKVQLEVRQQITTKKRDLRRECPLKHAEQAASPEPRPSAEVIAREAWTRLLAGQPAHYQKMIHLRLQGHTLEEISSRLDLNERTVRRALAKMFQERVE